MGIFKKLVFLLLIFSITCTGTQYRTNNDLNFMYLPDEVKEKMNNMVVLYEQELVFINETPFIAIKNECRGIELSTDVILTSAHCVLESDIKIVQKIDINDKSISEYLNVRYFKLLYLSYSDDYAILIKNSAKEDNIRVQELEYEKLVLGQEVYYLDQFFKSHKGYIQRLNVYETLNSDQSVTIHQMSSSIKSGDSGSPIFNSKGAIIGVVCCSRAEQNQFFFAPVPNFKVN